MIKEMAFVVYPVADMQRAVTFYRDTVGLKPGETLSERWTEFDVGAGTFGVIIEAEQVGISPGSQFSVAFEVDDVNVERERIRAAGVTVTDIMESPVCFSCFVTDPDGNRFAMHQRKNGVPGE